jgi:hypothetical protein
MGYDNSIEITYSVFGYDDVGETTFNMDVSDNMYNKLQDAEDEGELLDSDFLSMSMTDIHKKILKSIRENMEEETMNPDDGMVEKSMPWGYKYKEYKPSHSHRDISFIADDDDIEYEVNLY